MGNTISKKQQQILDYIKDEILKKGYPPTVRENVAKFVRNHKEKFLGAGLLLAAADGIRVRLDRNKDQKAFEESSVKQQMVARKHEAEINALRAEAEQAREVNRRVDQLEQIVKNITEGGGGE